MVTFDIVDGDVTSVIQSTDGATGEENNWESLPLLAQKAAKILGYTEENWNASEMNNSEMKPDSHHKLWKDLNATEKQADFT